MNSLLLHIFCFLFRTLLRINFTLQSYSYSNQSKFYNVIKELNRMDEIMVVDLQQLELRQFTVDINETTDRRIYAVCNIWSSSFTIRVINKRVKSGFCRRLVVNRRKAIAAYIGCCPSPRRHYCRQCCPQQRRRRNRKRNRTSFPIENIYSPSTVERIKDREIRKR